MPRVTSYRHGVPNWIDVSTPDIPASVAFYSALFGWDAEDQGEMAGNYHLLRRDGAFVAGLGPLPPTGQPAAWLAYLAVDDIDAAAAAITAHGGTLMTPVMDVMDAGRMVVAMDPAGGALGVWQAKQHIGSELVNEANAPVWHECATTDAAAAAPFYTAVFGWTLVPMDPSDESGHGYQIFNVDGRTVGGFMPMVGDDFAGIPSHWNVYIAVDDADATAARVTELGGSVIAPPFDIPIGRTAAFADPAGAMFMVIALHEIDDPNAGWTS